MPLRSLVVSSKKYLSVRNVAAKKGFLPRNNLEDVETFCKFGRVRSLHGAGAFHLGGNRYAFLSASEGGEEEEEGVIAVTCNERSSKLPLFYFPPDGAASFEVDLPEGCSVEVPGGQFVSRQGGFEVRNMREKVFLKM